MGKRKPPKPPSPPQQIICSSSRSENETPSLDVDSSKPSSAGGPTVISGHAVEIPSYVIVPTPPNAQSIVLLTVLASKTRADLKIASGEPYQSLIDTAMVGLPTNLVPKVRVPEKEASGTPPTVDQAVNPNIVALNPPVNEPKVAG